MGEMSVHGTLKMSKTGIGNLNDFGEQRRLCRIDRGPEILARNSLQWMNTF
jgi:hypothetical protein